ncbi:hypothetical protein IGI04_027300, partial [Brassica rapa subsp. trilocularis]
NPFNIFKQTMTKLKPNKKENKSKTSEEPTPRKSQQEVLSMSTLERWNDFFCSEENMGGGYWWLELSWCLDGHGSFHPNPSELRRLCSFEHEDVNSLCSLSSNALKALSRNKDIEK